MRLFNKNNICAKAVMFAAALLPLACSKSGGGTNNGGADTVVVPPPATFDINSINDTYAEVAPFANYLQWGSYNVHDPSIKKFGDYYYCYSTDAGYGIDVRLGLQIRKSKDLVQWQFVGWVFNSLPTKGADYIKQQSGTPNNSLWAPYVMKVGSEYRLYYSLSSATARLSVIGLATATNPEGPWTEKGTVVVSTNNAIRQTNAIDPTVIVTPAGEHWMYYGSAWDGIYVLKLDPATGLANSNGDIGVRVANRGYTSGKYNGNIEGAEIIYNADQKKYYLFIAYDWLETKYNIRVGKGDSPQGPFYDFNGVDINTDVDHAPMIVAPYQFSDHSGWQGVSHCTVFDDGAGNYYIGHQGRPAINKYFMDLHVRKLFWTKDGWPVASPERYAWEDNSLVAKDSLAGNWEQIILGYRVVPGYSAEQASPDFQVSQGLTIGANGTLNGDAASTWTYTAPWLEMHWSNGYTDKVFVQKGRDWEHKKQTIIFSGLNNTGTAIWGKKK
ncbi:arabinan endo-1,5-alpha-L-arabinosidase [Pinibacter soli]|uniref:Arabinan endo-1,5-alpha-L-arabinosidase n=1 Tax=Pinibacter soli TaxID=3044211 RepID=A0ABT6RHA8_9BACT|nr:arabinan endo-1,5-alpha-L-arabinosidase [Pinibacter soli]MDI3321957.1 arabinan endo-1,5-alpha-L-arabinosidase [Pinibacter soli]